MSLERSGSALQPARVEDHEPESFQEPKKITEASDTSMKGPIGEGNCPRAANVDGAFPNARSAQLFGSDPHLGWRLTASPTKSPPPARKPLAASKPTPGETHQVRGWT